MKQLLVIMVGLSLIGMTACSSQKAGEAKGDLVNVQSGDSHTKVDKDGNVSVQSGDSTVNVQGGNVDIQGEGSNVNIQGGNIDIQDAGGSVQIKDGKISIKGMDDIMKDVEVETGE